MDDTARADALLRRLKKEMNGVVVGAMETHGIHYPISYGVSLPTIREAAKACVPDHAFAALLFARPERELKLAAVWIDRPEWVTREQMETWGGQLTNSEIVEQVATFLFGAAPDAISQALRWMETENPWLHYAALLMAAKALTLPGRATGAQVLQLVNGVDMLARRTEFTAYAVRAAALTLARCASLTPAAARTVRSLCEVYAASEPPLRALADELSWQIEYF